MRRGFLCLLAALLLAILAGCGESEPLTILAWEQEEAIYGLNVQTGELFRQTDSESWQSLGRCQTERELDKAQDLQMQQTAGGNYLFSCYTMESGAITVWRLTQCWLCPATGEACTAESTAIFRDDVLSAPLPFVLGGQIWLPGADVVYQIDDEAGRLLQTWDLGQFLRASQGQADLTAEAAFVWTDGQYLLLNGDNGKYWTLVDLATENCQPLQEQLLTPENKARLEELARPYIPDFDAEYRDYFWGALGSEFSIDPHAELRFVEAQDSKLYFQLAAVWLTDGQGQPLEQDVSIMLEISVERVSF